MSNLFGGGAKVASMTPTRAMGIQFMSSQYGPPVPVVYGTGKVGGTCIWYGDFASTSHSQKVGKGGGSRSTSYTYSASFMLGLCEGPITGFGTVYDGTSTVSLSSVGAVTANGAAGQAPWSHLSGAFALGYSNTAWIAVQNMQLGSSASLPNWNVEVQGFHIYPGSSDANPADILTDICTDTTHGIDFGYLGDLTQYSNYCVATGLLLSPVYDQEQTAQQTLSDLFKFTNSATYFSEGVLKVVPYGDTAVTGNGVTYTPNNSPLVNLGSADYIVSPGEDAIQITRKAPADAMNMVRVQYQDRSNTYHDSVVVASIDEDVILNGSRADTTEDASICKNAATARFIAQNLVQRSFFVRNTYEFKLGWRYCYLEPMDIVTLTDANTGLNLWPVRIVDVTEDENGDLAITAEEYPEGVGHSAIYNTQPNNGGSIDPNTDPGAVNPPYIFRGPGFLTSNSSPEIWLAVNGSGALWGGADVYLSHDGSSYNYAGTVAQPARYGSLTTALGTGSDPDTTNTPEVTVYAPAQLLGGSQADADNLVTLAMVDTEIFSYKTSTLVSSGTYQLGYLRRGAYGSTIASHALGAPFVRLDDAIFRLPIDPSMIGQTIYVKFLSLNAFGRTPRTLAGETAYTYVVGTNVELPDVPPVPASFATQGVADGVSITWSNSNPAAVGCTSIERATASGGPWTVIAQVGQTTTGYTDHFTTGATYYYRARARGPLVSSGWSAYTSVYNSTGTNVGAISTTANQALTDAEQALTNAANALYAADGKAEITVGTTAPSSPRAGDIWYDTSVTPDAAYVWNGSAWAPADSAAQAQAATAASAASAASTLAGTKAEVTVGSTAPSGPHTGDIWYDTATSPYAAYAWNGAAWVSLDSYAQGLANNAQNTANTALTSVVVQNANFTNGLFGWTLTPSSDFYQENGTNNPNPNISTYLVHKGVSGETYANAVSTTGAPVVPGQTVTAIMCLEEFSANSTATANAAIFWYTNSGSYIGESASTMTCGVSGTATRLNSKVIAQAPSNAAFAMVGAEWHNHTSGYINATTASLTLQPSSVDDVPDGSIYLRQTLVNGTAISIPNSTWQMPLDASGNIPGWFTKSGTSGLSTSVVKFGKQSIILSSTSSSPGVLQCRTQYKVIPGDYIAIEGWANAVSGTKCCLAANFIDANGNYLGDIEAQVTTGAWTQAQAGGVVPSNAAAMYLQAYLYEPSSGTAYAYFNEVDVKINDLRTAGSGAQMGDLRNLKQRSVTNVPAKVPTTISYSANAGSPAAATISIAAFTVLAGSVSVSYNAMSVSTTGTNGANVTYYLYFDDPTYAGGTQTLVATTNGNDCYASDARVYVGSIAVAYPTSGGGSGGGGGGGMCVCAHMWLDEDTQARECKRGYIADCLDLPSSGLRKFRRRLLGMEMDVAPCVRITTAGGAVLECSTTTPFDLLDGRTARAPDMEGEQVVTDRGIERVTSVIDIGEQLVCHQHYGGCSYAAGVDPGHRIYSHNTFEKP